MGKILAISAGDKFSHFTVWGRLNSRSGALRKWICRCECGIFKLIEPTRLMSGEATSCGCSKANRSQNGLSKTREYQIWYGMIRRCTDKNSISYKDYGGRGIAVCERWNAFENFYRDMGNPPSDKFSLERKNNSLGYFKENCVWATAIDQRNNTRNNIFLVVNDERKTAAQWARIFDLHPETIRARKRNGWSDEKCVLTPVSKSSKLIKVKI